MSSSAAEFTRVKAHRWGALFRTAAVELDYASPSRRAMESASMREWAPSLRYTDDVMVLTVLCETYRSLAISRMD
jgi:hypothetical protein